MFQKKLKNLKETKISCKLRFDDVEKCEKYTEFKKHIRDIKLFFLVFVTSVEVKTEKYLRNKTQLKS